MARLTINNLTKRFGSVVAVRDLSLDIADREFMVLLGPSGAGKTTTLRCIAGVEKPDVGEIFFDDHPMSRVSPAERDVALVFQTYALYPRKSAYENIAFPLEARKLSRSQIDAAVHEVARKLHIEHLLGRRPAQLSGGEQQRVALGRAMVRRPRAFLMDEPLTNLDFKLRVEMRSELKHIHRDLNTTLFYVTNDQTEAMSLADRIAVLDEGALQQVGTPEEIYDHPVNYFVASFIGSPRMNFLRCSLRNGSEPALTNPAGAWQLPIAPRYRDAIRSRSEADAFTLGVRSEDIRLSLHPEPDAIQAHVYVVEPLGDRTIFDLRLGDEPIKVRTAPDFVSEPDVPPGTPVWLTLDSERIHLFDRQTGQTVI
jgi:multiple sugar transport system ATP-binding protein